MRRSLTWIACGIAVFAGGCDDTSAPSGNGDHVVSDVPTDAATPPQPSEDAALPPDSPFAIPDALYAPAPDGYSPLSVCDQCACEAGTYCFGGGTGDITFSGTCDQSGGASGTLRIGCLPMPDSCANEPDCVCLITALAPSMPCYPECTETSGFNVFCPTP